MKSVCILTTLLKEKKRKKDKEFLRYNDTPEWLMKGSNLKDQK